MATNIYEQHRAAFRHVSAYVVTDAKGERVASVAFKYPSDGAGRLYAYVHWYGVEMVRGFASGCGYDKHSAAVANAVSKVRDGLNVNQWEQDVVAAYDAFRGALATDDGRRWDDNLRRAGFTVFQAV